MRAGRARRARAGLQHDRAASGSSTRIARALVLAEPPSIDANEITDKGYINQRAVLEHRAALVERLYSEPAAAELVVPLDPTNRTIAASVASG